MAKPRTPLTDTEKKQAWIGELQISNTADNADITQSQARHTRHRRMQEAYAQIVDHFGPNTVLWAFHTIQLPSRTKVNPNIMTNVTTWPTAQQK